MSTSLSAAALPALVRASFPDLAFEQVEIPGQGLDHAVAILLGNPAGPLVARAPYTAAYRAQARTEAAVLAEISHLTEVTLPVAVRATTDGALTVHTLVPGSPLSAAALQALGARRDSAHRQLGQLLAVLHSRDIAAPPFKQVEPWRIHGRANPAPRSLPAKISLLRARADHVLPAVLSSPELRDVERFFADMNVLLDPHRPARLIHGDLYDQHLLWENHTGRLGVIDFSDMNLGDPAVDFAHLPDPAGVLNHYGAEADEEILERAAIYRRWDAVYLLVDHLRTGRTSAESAWPGFRAARAELAG